MNSELDRRQVVETRMRSHGIVMPMPGLDDHLCCATTAKPLDREARVAEPSVEALVAAVLLGFAGADQGCFDTGSLHPLENRLADELGSVVRAQVSRCAALANQADKHLDHPDQSLSGPSGFSGG